LGKNYEYRYFLSIPGSIYTVLSYCAARASKYVMSFRSFCGWPSKPSLQLPGRHRLFRSQKGGSGEMALAVYTAVAAPEGGARVA
jgi:hypothetical protein